MGLQGLRGALNALLFRTGDQSRDFAVILATNRPADLDAAVIDRMDEAIEFALPGKQERKQILKMYVDSYIARAGTQEGPLSIECPYLTDLCPSSFMPGHPLRPCTSSSSKSFGTKLTATVCSILLYASRLCAGSTLATPIHPHYEKEAWMNHSILAGMMIFCHCTR